MIFLTWCNWYNSVTFYEFESVYDPTYLKLNLNDRNSWKIYMEKVKSIYVKLLGVKNTEMTLKDIRAFTKIYT